MNNEDMPTVVRDRITRDSKHHRMKAVYFCSIDHCSHQTDLGRPCIYEKQHEPFGCGALKDDTKVKLIKFEYEVWKTKW